MQMRIKKFKLWLKRKFLKEKNEKYIHQFLLIQKFEALNEYQKYLN